MLSAWQENAMAIATFPRDKNDKNANIFTIGGTVNYFSIL